MEGRLPFRCGLSGIGGARRYRPGIPNDESVVSAGDSPLLRALYRGPTVSPGNLASRPLVIRVGLVALAIPYTVLAVWLLFAPHSFYESFPGFGVHWVRPMGVYSQHGFTDFGTALLGLAFVAWIAAYVLEQRLVQVALIASLLQGRLTLRTTCCISRCSRRPTTFGNQTALSYFVLLPIALLLVVRRERRPRVAGD